MNLGQLQLARWLEKGFVVSAFVLATLPGWDEGTVPGREAGQGAVVQALWAGAYLLVAAMLLLRRADAQRVMARSRWLWALLLLILISAAWSAEPGDTLRHGVGLLGTTLFGVYVATRYSFDEQLHLVGSALAVAALLSLAAALALPAHGIHVEPAGSMWQGIYPTKNGLGRWMALLAVVMFLCMGRGRWRLLAGVGFLLAVALLLLSRSRTSQMACLSVLSLAVFYRVLRWHLLQTVAVVMFAIAAAGALATWVLSDPKIVLGAMGKDATLTNRTPLWAAVLEMIGKRPWLGYGYTGFWQGWHGESAHICRVSGWIPPHAHNGFLDVWLDLGLVGLTIFLLGLLLTFARSMRCARQTTTVGGLWPIIFLSFMLLYNLTETLILRPHNLFWILLVAIVLSRPGPRAAEAESSHEDHHPQ